MGEKESERKDLLWWLERENTNTFWSAKNPWIVIAMVATVLIVLCMAATFLWEMPRMVANAIVNVIFYGYLAILFVYEVRAKRYVAALGVAAAAAFKALIWGLWI